MVRLIPVERGGKTVWVEDAPTHCAEGHQQLVPSYGKCPVCDEPARLWRCRAEGCTAQDQYDDEHVHHGRRGLRLEHSSGEQVDHKPGEASEEDEAP